MIYVKATDLTPGMRTVLGTVVETKLSPSGKTMTITVAKDGGRTFTDRIPASEKKMVFDA